MKHPARLTSALLGLLLLVGLTVQSAHADDGIFPPAPAAAPFINFDGKGFLLNGKRTFLVSGGMEYCRVPRTLWRDRLLRLKRAGFNTVAIYEEWSKGASCPATQASIIWRDRLRDGGRSGREPTSNHDARSNSASSITISPPA